MKSAAIYARVSSERQKEEQTIKSQTAALKEAAKERDYLIPPQWIFEDEGYSGAVLVRPGLDRIRDLASEGQIEAVLVYSPDRCARLLGRQMERLYDVLEVAVSAVSVSRPRPVLMNVAVGV